MAEEITEILQRFDLSTKERGETKLDLGDVGSSGKECKYYLVGKILGDKIINLVGVKIFVKLEWGYLKGLRVVEVGFKPFQFVIPIDQENPRI